MSIDSATVNTGIPPLLESALDSAGLSDWDDALSLWLRDALATGANTDEIVEALVAAGRPALLSAMATALARRGMYLTRQPDERLIVRSGMGTPDAAHAGVHTLPYDNRMPSPIRKVVSLSSPQIVVYDNFINDEEIQYLKAAVHGRLERSSVVGDGRGQVVGNRTSAGAFIEAGSHPILRRLEKRIEQVCGWPVIHGEAMQVLHYTGVEEYQPHFDFFEPQNPAEEKMYAEQGNRVGTMLLYMNDVEEGGSTYFPKLDLAVHPRKGAALWFAYLDNIVQDAVPDYRTEHAGLPMVSGTKWIATKWVRAKPFPAYPMSSIGMRQAPPPGY